MKGEPLKSRMRAFLEEDGVSATEYAILLAVIVLGSVGVIRSIGQSFQGIYLAIAAKIPEA